MLRVTTLFYASLTRSTLKRPKSPARDNGRTTADWGGTRGELHLKFAKVSCTNRHLST